MLNPTLFATMQQVFGQVWIHSEDTPADRFEFIVGSALSQERKDPFFRPKGGEHYSVTCPFCGKRDKLYVNYCFGTVAPPGPGQDPVPCANNVFHCYYCEFEKLDYKKRNKFISALETGAASGMVINLEEQRTASASVVRRPEDHFPVCVPMNAPEAECGRLYLESRNYNVEEVINQWGVFFSTDPAYFQAPYLVFPIFCYGKLLTWQARYIGDDYDLRGCPKYYFDPSGRKSEVLFNMDRARHNTLGILLEGIPAAIRVGPKHSVCSFGKDPSIRQLRLLRSLYGDGTLVVMFDNDARDRTNERLLEWQTAGWFRNLINIELPDDRDPGDYTTEENWRLINTYLKERR